MEIKKFDIFKKKQKLEVEEFKEARSELLDDLLANPIESDEFKQGVENLEKLNKVVLDIEESKKKQPKEIPWEFIAACVGGAVQVGCTFLIVFAENEGVVNSKAFQWLKMRK